MTTFLGKDRKGRPFSTISAAAWNARFPVGTPVVYSPTLDCPDKEKWGSLTRSEAWELGHGEPVVMIEGKSGGKALWALAVVMP